MTREEEILKERLKKLKELRGKGIEPFKYKYEKKNSTSEILENPRFKKLKKDSITKTRVKIAGRVLVLRMLGKINFMKIQDENGEIQVVIQKNKINKKKFNFFRKFIDIGDFVGIEGKVMKTRTGEISVLAEKIELLTKSLLPLPEKFHGLRDKEERYRKRYLDLINPETKKIFIQRAKIINLIREFLNSKGAIEVEIPLLQKVYGGAEAEPFKTHLNALDLDLYLSISPELFLKRLIIGGFEKVYTICKNFRNEGIDRLHNPEFTMLEYYEAYSDYKNMIKLTKEMIIFIVKKIHGRLKINYQNKIIDFKKFQEFTMQEALKKFGKIDICRIEKKELQKKVRELKIQISKEEMENEDCLINVLFENLVQPKLIQPTFILDYPLSLCPLTKKHRINPKFVERFELFINGIEIANAYSELNNPEEQEERFKKQAEKRKKGFISHPYDKDFITALKYGMPPTGGVGIGIDRLVMILTNQNSIREVILFPFMKEKF